jgi:hypothetical protein
MRGEHAPPPSAIKREITPVQITSVLPIKLTEADRHLRDHAPTCKNKASIAESSSNQNPVFQEDRTKSLGEQAPTKLNKKEDPTCAFCRCEEESHAHLFFACSWTGCLWAKIKSWLRIGRRMLTLNRSLRGLNSKRSNLEFQMRRVSLAITVYLIWEERNKRVFDGKSRGVDTMFRSFQILFYIVFRFHEKDHLQLAVG